jgi:MFS transporter, OFA family, oxalate/formate antiporter
MTTRSSNTLAAIRAMTGLCLSGFLLFGIGVYSFTQFLEPLAHEFGWGRASLGGLMGAFWISAPFAVPAAYLLPRLGIRRVLLIGALVEALTLAAMVGATQQWQFILLRFGMGAGKVFIATPLPIKAAQWFVRRPGMAIAVSLCGWHVGGLVMAPLSASLIAAVGWRHAMLILAAILFVGMLLAILLLRDPSTPDASGQPALAKTTPGSDLGKWPPQWAPLAAVILGTVAFYIGYAGILAQLSPLLADCGFDAHDVGRLTGSVAICAAIGVLVAGGITQLLSARYGGAIALLLMGLTAGTAMLLSAASPAPLSVAVVILLGLLVGGGDPILIESLRQIVPSHHFERAYGWWYLLCLVALGVAPVLTGLAFDHTGSYRSAFLSICISCLVVMVLWLIGLRAVKPEKTASVVVMT